MSKKLDIILFENLEYKKAYALQLELLNKRQLILS
jgi:hypothetical protein